MALVWSILKAANSVAVVACPILGAQTFLQGQAPKADRVVLNVSSSTVASGGVPLSVMSGWGHSSS